MEINGQIVDNNNNPITGVKLYFNDEGIASALVLPTSYFKAWTDNVDTAVLCFEKSGYEKLSIPFIELQDNVVIVMEKSFPVALLAAGLGAAYLLSKKKNKQVGKLEREDVLLIGGGLVGLIVVTKLIKILGLGGDPSAGEQTNPLSPWKPEYWKQFSYFSYVINEAEATQLAKTIHGAFTLFQDDYNAVLSVFNRMKTKANVSYLSDIFSRIYKEDLLSFLGDGGGVLPWDGLSQDHMQTLINYVNKLPTN